MPSFHRCFLAAVPAPLTAVLLGCAVMVSGCAPAAAPPRTVATHDHDHSHDHGTHDHGTKGGHGHEHPTTLAAGLVELEKLLGTVGEKLRADAKDAADDAVHAAGHLLEDLRGLLQKADLAADVKEAGTKSLDELFACFDKLDTALHAGADVKESPAEVHASLEERFKAALAVLKQHVGGTGTGEKP
jgi:hypothetical protein